jgi:hypothetical protein
VGAVGVQYGKGCFHVDAKALLCSGQQLRKLITDRLDDINQNAY